MAIACDARIMSSNGVIGLNEAAFGLVVPTWGIDAISDIMGKRQAQKCCTIGTIFKADQALQLGLIDILVSSPDDVLPEAHKEVARWNVPGRAGSKGVIRADRVKKFHDTGDADIANFLGLVGHERTQAALGAYLASLKKGKK
jgi:3,2-trans-enoyl-CoA isomerase